MRVKLLIQELLGCSTDHLAKYTHIDRSTLTRWLSGKSTQRSKSLNALYDYAFSQGIRLNNIKAQLYREDFEPKGLTVLFHGSKEGLMDAPSLARGRERCDFGRGFYCGTGFEQPAMFVSSYPNPLLYIGALNEADLGIERFSIERDWMLAVSWYRGKLAEYGGHPIISNIRERIEQADCIVAPIADNRMFEILDSFAEGELTEAQCNHCLSATDLGSQYVLRTQRSLDALKIVECFRLCPLEKKALLEIREESARFGLSKVKAARRQYRNEGLYIEELLS